MRLIVVPVLFFSLRILDPAFAALLLTNIDRSPTLRFLVDSLERSDVIVHVVNRPQPGNIGGTTTFVTRTRGHRYLRVALSRDLQGRRWLSMLGHELQHALEVAGAPGIVDQRTMAAHYTRAGRRCHWATNAFDTDTAAAAGARVLDELHGATDAATSSAPRQPAVF